MSYEEPKSARARAWEHARFKAATDGGEVEDYLPDWVKKKRTYAKGDYYQRGESRYGDVVDDYYYYDENADFYLRVERTSDKQFPQSHWDAKQQKWVYGKPQGPKIPYELPQLIEAEPEKPIYICEGEKDANNVGKLGLVATTNSEGAGKWSSDLNKWFIGKKRVYIIADNDEPGRRHAEKVARNLIDLVEEVRIANLPGLEEGGDVSDWLAVGGGNTKEKLVELCAAAPLYEGFISGPKGILPAKPHNIRLALDKLGVELRFNEFAHRAEISGGEVDDDAINTLRLTIEKRWGFLAPKELFHDVVRDEALAQAYHPVRQYLADLTWDGTRRLDKWLITYGGAEDTPYTWAVGALILIAAVRRVRQPGCKFDELLVLEAAQGRNKSLALATLAGQEWFGEELPLVDDTRRVIEATKGNWIVEAAELKGVRRADVEHLKAMLSRQVDQARLAYAREPKSFPRQCIIVGTTNDAQYLRDGTGNRRFWPVKIDTFDTGALQQDRDQLWAEAAQREAAGESIRLHRSLWEVAAAHQEAREIDDPYVVGLRSVFGDMTGKVAVRDVWKVLGIVVGNRTQEQNARLGGAMQKLGWERRKLRFGGENPDWAYCKGSNRQKLQTIVVTVNTDNREASARYETAEERAKNEEAARVFEEGEAGL